MSREDVDARGNKVSEGEFPHRLPACLPFRSAAVGTASRMI